MLSPCRFSNASIIACGAAEPPTTMRRTDDVSYLPGFASSSWRIPIQIVGTPAVIVTCSCWNASSRLSPSRNGPGKTCLAPTKVQVNGKPHALAWNIGTTGSTVSSSVTARTPATADASECTAMARCE